MTKETEHLWPEGQWDWPIQLPYKHGVKRGLIFVGGQVAMDEEGNVLYPGDVVRQTGIAMENIKKVLAGFGAGMDDIVKLNRFYVGSASKEDWEVGARVAASYFKEPGPAVPGIPVPARVRGPHGGDQVIAIVE